MKIQDWLGEDNRIGIDIWEKKYRYEDETFDDWLDRVSAGDGDIKELIKDKKFLFGGRILANRGLHKKGMNVTYSNCYVLAQPEDNIESIFETAGKLARTFSYGGGVGIDLSKLAPRGAKINNTAKATSGSVSFTDLYSMTTDLIGQHGRRGALMLSISCEHPDLVEFMRVKTDLDRVTKANMSIRMTDNFMESIKNRKTFLQEFHRKETDETITNLLDAERFFEEMCEANWDYGEPACLFWDRIENWNLLSEYPDFEFAGTNPCGEQPLPAGGSCLLGSINLAEFVEDGQFDFDGFWDAIIIAVRGLNDVLDEGLPLHPLKEQRDSVRNWRQIGLGVMGLADMLIKLELRYGSAEAVDFCDDLFFIMANRAINESARIAGKKGRYPKYDEDKILSSGFFNENTTQGTRDLVCEHGLRNSQILTIAPTGSISTMLGISGGIEPIFANSYNRRTVSLSDNEETYKVYTPIVKKYMDKTGKSEDELPEYFVTAHDIHYKDRINLQSACQKHIDASISSTINIPNDFRVKDVEELYLYAWEQGCKGVTVFRDGCMRDSILTHDEPLKGEEHADVLNGDIVGKKRKLMTGCGSLHCTAFFNPDTGDLVEVYLNKGSTGGCNNFMIGLSRMMSLSARNGCHVFSIVDQLKSCGACPSYAVRSATKKDTSKGASCPVAVGYALVDMWKEMQAEIRGCDNIPAPAQKVINPCPSCGDELIQEGGCNICKSCGWTLCD